VIARTDPNEQESVVLMPELDDIHGGISNSLRGDSSSSGTGRTEST
jgi:hypothetical protein